MEEERLTSIVVLAHPGSEPLVDKVWKQSCDWPLVVFTWDGTLNLKQLLEAILAGQVDEAIADRFVVVPANLVPVTFDKEVLVDWLPEHDQLADEDFVRQYVQENAPRALEVSHNFGNYYTKVLRANPCEHIVIEALIRKRFLYVSSAGWPAVTGLIKSLLKEG